MITNEELSIILEKKDPGDIEMIKVISKYIYDKTNEDISGITINKPTDQGNIFLMHHMFKVAKQFYLNGK
mgnify:CR=1 FL=1